ncbi:MAG: phosphoesterase [Francisellaceae bacterium]|jgi:intracellular multiplication protein IcmT|nr:phosphoesterase [Francisellaceae bacterium]MBT6206902.1 phosphoesterase [Francisellaceae bacterium]MBT6538273.1 phosphoesterase [Francisellaceae bacterium]
MVNDNSHWRDSSRQARFFIVDALAAVPLLFVFLHIRLWTVMIALSIMVFFSILEKFQFTVPVFFRFVRSFLAGPVKASRPWWRE